MTKEYHLLQKNERIDGGRYTVVKRIYPGGKYSQIYLVQNNRFPVEHYLKINLPHEVITNKRKLSEAVYLGSKTDHLERNRKEVELLSKFLHPHIIKVHDFFPIRDDYTAIVFEPLSPYFISVDAMPKRIYVTPDLCLAFFSQIMKAVDFIKENGYLHHDIKPENILFEQPSIIWKTREEFFLKSQENQKNGIFKLIDFGLAAPVDNCNSFWGSALYRPPEAYRGEPHSNSDLWNLGLVFYELLSGKFFFGSKNESTRESIEMLMTESKNSKSAAQQLEDLIEKKINHLLFAYRSGKDELVSAIYCLNYLLKPDPQKRDLGKALLFNQETKAEALEAVKRLPRFISLGNNEPFW